MYPAGSLNDLDGFPLDALGQQPRINRIYTQITLCFPRSYQSLISESAAIRTLQHGLEKLSTSFPWTAGKVVKEHGLYKIKPREMVPYLAVKDLTLDDFTASWEILQKARCPFSMLDESTVAPVKTSVEETVCELPVFLVQANFISGGLLVTFSGQHGSMDMTGLGEVIRLFAKACRNEPFTVSELSVGNMNRTNIFTPAKCDKHSPSKTTQKAVPPEPPRNQDPSVSWAYFMFSAAMLGVLKSEVMNTIPMGTFVSTDDALSAFFWRSITRARLHRLGTGLELASTLSRNVDVRRYLSLPPGYPGLITTSTSHSMLLDVLTGTSLGSLASELRSALDPETLAARTRTSATRLINGGSPEASFASTSTPALDVRLSSWAKEKCYELDFGAGQGGLGKPQIVRRPKFVDGAREGLVYFLPKALDGEIAVGVCLRDVDLEVLKMDNELMKYATYIG